MKKDTAIDYQAALDAYRREEHTSDDNVHSTDQPVSPPMTDGVVDYEVATKIWDKGQKDLYIVHQKG